MVAASRAPILEQLIQEAVVTVPRALVAETIDLIAVLAGRGAERRLAELALVAALNAAGDYALRPLIRALPERLIADAAYGSAPMPDWLVEERGHRERRSVRDPFGCVLPGAAA